LQGCPHDLQLAPQAFGKVLLFDGVVLNLRQFLDQFLDAVKASGEVLRVRCGHAGTLRPVYKGIYRFFWSSLSSAARIGVVQRGGKVRFKLLDGVTADRLSEFIAENADLSCRLITDGYKNVGRAFEGGTNLVRLYAYFVFRIWAD
jgi:hypothetical protein